MMTPMLQLMAGEVNVNLPSGQTLSLSLQLLWLAVALVVGITVVAIGLQILRTVLRRRHQASATFRKRVMLVTVPKESAEKGESGMQEKTLQEIKEDIGVMEGVFAAVGGLRAQRGLKAWLYGREDEVAFEIVAQDGLVSFYVAATPELKDFVEQQIQSQFPHAQIEGIADYNIFHHSGVTVGLELAYKRQTAFPIKDYTELDHDPLNNLTNALSKVESGDGAAVQVIVRSAPKAWRRPALKIVRAMQQGKKLSEALAELSIWRQLSGIFRSKRRTKDGEPFKEYKMSPKEEEMVRNMEDKASRMGLDVNIRLIASAANQPKVESYINNLAGAFSQYGLPQFGNEFSKRYRKTKKLIPDFIYRQFNPKAHSVMTGRELAGIYHMPLPSTETPNIRWLTSRKAPPPPGLPKEGLFVGNVHYRGVKTPVHMKTKDRMRHLYVIGKSGTGKSVTLAGLIEQDIKNGHGVCVVDPNGDLAEDTLAMVPKERAEDVVLFDPSDTERPVGLNMLEAPSEEMKDFVVGEMIAIFYKMFGAEMIGPMFEHVMRNVMLTLMSDSENPGTIVEVPRLIVDPEYQKQWVAKVKDQMVRDYWEKEVAKTSDFHKSEMFGYLTSKVGRFVENGMLRNIIGQQKSTFDFRDIMDNGKIFVVNLAKGKIGDINAQLLGMIIVTKLQMAAFGRADLPEEERRPFYLYLDEFQNFVTPSIATILSEARKYALSLTVAHQYMGQLAPKGDTEIRDAVMGNVGAMMIGRIGIDDAQILEKEFAPVFNAYDLVNVEKFTFNMKMLVDGQSTRPFNVKSPPPTPKDRKLGEAIRTLARLKFGRDRWIVEQEIMERTRFDDPAAPASKDPTSSK